MADKSVKKVDASHAPEGQMGQTYLAAGTKLSMRLWRENPGDAKEKSTHKRSYETVGYVIKGKAELHLEDQQITLEKGDSWVVPADAEHTYKIVEDFEAIEATAPPARAHARDEEE